MLKRHIPSLLIIILMALCKNSYGQEYKQIWMNFNSNGTAEYAIYIPDFSIDNAESIFDKYIKNFKILSKVMKKLDALDITFWDTDLPNIKEIMETFVNPPVGTRSIYASYSKRLDVKYMDKKITTY